MTGRIVTLGYNPHIKGSIERIPIASKDLWYEEGALVSLMRQAVVRSMSESAGVETDGNRTLWRPHPFQRVRRDGASYYVHDAILVYLRCIGTVQHLVLMPSLRVFGRNGAEPTREVADTIKRKILGYQHNKPFNRSVNGWRKTLFTQGPVSVFEFPYGAGVAFRFRVRRSPIFANIGLLSGGLALRVPNQMKGLVTHRGLQLNEPSLLFSNRTGTALVRDAHPIRGILRNRPYDYPLTSRGLTSSVRIGIVCPATETQALDHYVQSINRTLQPGSGERDYLLNYPGFQTAYGLPAELPQPNGAGWMICPEPSTHNQVQGTLETARLIERCIERLEASNAPDVVLIYIPDRWQCYRGFSNESERFDLHNFVKAYCVQRGIASQFLNEDTLSNRYQCRVWWWLSLALYVKSMRTPWLLTDLADDTAFVGLGYSIDSHAQKGNHIVLGCSHIYSARGEGLQYRLSKIEDPIIRRGRPFMSADDAQRVGESIRQLFFDARMNLPERVVLHKRTHFTKEEREGLRDGLCGVQRIDMLEIQIDHALRYMASIHKRDGSIDEDNFPVRRGTTIRLDDFSALVWVHGATMALNPQRKYYQGKRRIPAPLIVKRHAGRTALSVLAAEILGLSKMNWNTFDLYTKLPATLQSSREIAAIGSLLQRFDAASYDYRLFI